MATDRDATVASEPTAEAAPPKAPGSRRKKILLLVLAVVVLDIIALLLVPPFPKGGTSGDACAFPVCFIDGSLELPPPHTVIDFAPNDPLVNGGLVVAFHPSISNTILTMWIVSAILIIALVAITRGRAMVPGRLQNVAEFAYEGLSDFAVSLGGPAARPYIPLFAALFLYILFSNWAGLVPPIGKIDELRAPTSDVNITLGLALVAFLVFEFEGFRINGVRGYLSKFFPIGAFREGFGAGVLAMYVGLIELLLEFIKPLTLSMRLFGNIYGGEVALGVITALTLAIIPVALLGLEVLLNFIQALIFSVLTLMFTLIAIEGHSDPTGHPQEEPGEVRPLGDMAGQPSLTA